MSLNAGNLENMSDDLQKHNASLGISNENFERDRTLESVLPERDLAGTDSQLYRTGPYETGDHKASLDARPVLPGEASDVAVSTAAVDSGDSQSTVASVGATLGNAAHVVGEKASVLGHIISQTAMHLGESVKGFIADHRATDTSSATATTSTFEGARSPGTVTGTVSDFTSTTRTAPLTSTTHTAPLTTHTTTFTTDTTPLTTRTTPLTSNTTTRSTLDQVKSSWQVGSTELGKVARDAGASISAGAAMVKDAIVSSAHQSKDSTVLAAQDAKLDAQRAFRREPNTAATTTTTTTTTAFDTELTQPAEVGVLKCECNELDDFGKYKVCHAHTAPDLIRRASMDSSDASLGRVPLSSTTSNFVTNTSGSASTSGSTWQQVKDSTRIGVQDFKESNMNPSTNLGMGSTTFSESLRTTAQQAGAAIKQGAIDAKESIKAAFTSHASDDTSRDTTWTERREGAPAQHSTWQQVKDSTRIGVQDFKDSAHATLSPRALGTTGSTSLGDSIRTTAHHTADSIRLGAQDAKESAKQTFLPRTGEFAEVQQPTEQTRLLSDSYKADINAVPHAGFFPTHTVQTQPNTVLDSTMAPETNLPRSNPNNALPASEFTSAQVTASSLTDLTQADTLTAPAQPVPPARDAAVTGAPFPEEPLQNQFSRLTT